MDPEILQSWIDRFEQFAWEGGPVLDPLPRQQLQQILARLPSDESLALLIQRGAFWKEAFEELFVRRYQRYLLRCFWHWCGNMDRAGEMTQMVFCRFLENRLGSFDPARSFRAYLYQSARYLFLETARRESRIHSLEGIPEPFADDPPPATELTERFELALRQLPADERRVLSASVQGQSADEIALEVGLPKRRVYALLFQARRRVESALQCFLPAACGGVLSSHSPSPQGVLS